MSVDAAVRRPAHAAPQSSPRDVLPVAVLVVAALVLLANLVAMFAGGQQTGVSWDEPVQVERLQNYFETEWYLPDSQLVDGEPRPDARGVHVYAPVASLVAHAAAVVLGAESPGSTEVTAAAYEARHVGIGLMAVLGLVAVAVILRHLAGSWRWALLGAAMLSSIPLWTGHGMFNIKDLPAAVGYTVVTAGLVVLSRSRFGEPALSWLGSGAVALGVVLAVGTRPGLWVGLVVSVVCMLGLTYVVDRRVAADSALSLLLRRGQLVLLGAALGYVALVLIYPQLFSHPDRMVDSALESSDYPWVLAIRTAGIDMPMPPPWTYLPLWFGAQTPLVLLGLAVVGLIAPLVLLVRGLRNAAGFPHLVTGVGLALVSLQALLLPAAAVLRQAVLYDAQRQVLFVVPALAAAAAAATWLIVRRLRRSWLRTGLWVLVCVGMVVPTVGQVRLFPFGYTWFNAAAEVAPVDGAWMTDYWRTSSREAVTLLPAEGPESCILWRPATRLWPCGTLAPIQPYWASRGSAADAQLGLGEYWFTSFNRGVLDTPEECEVLGTVTRPLLTQRITMSYVARCTAELSEYPFGGIRAVKGSNGYLLWGWYPSGPDGTWSGGSPADVGMVLPQRLQDRPLRLELEVARYVPAGQTRLLTVSVNGTDVASIGFEDSSVQRLSIPVPADVAASWQGDQLLVRLEAPDPVQPQAVGDGDDARALGARLVSLSVLADS